MAPRQEASAGAGGGKAGPASAPPPAGPGARWRWCSLAAPSGWCGRRCGARLFARPPRAAGAARLQVPRPLRRGGGCWAGALGCPPAGEPSAELQFPAAAAGLKPDGSCGSECAEGAWDRARVCCGGQAGLARESCRGEGLAAALRRLSCACRRLDMSH